MNVFKSEFRQSDENDLFEKVNKQSYGKYLRKVVLKNIRAFRDKSVGFDYPVTALVGPNGGGKTTVLGAAALAYEDIRPNRFFAKSGKYDASMVDWAVEHELIDKGVNPRLSFQRTASFPSQKWNRRALKRDVLLFGVSRTLPATERKELTKAVGNTFAASVESELPEKVVLEVGRILGKEIAGFNELSIDSGGKTTFFAAKPPTGAAYSEFHFGAGEASVIKIVSEVERSGLNSLILIEEIENGLHPVATRRLVEYLLRVAKEKSAQVIFTTHSNDALEPLPAAAIWAAYDGNVLQGKLDVKALRTITGQVDAKLAIFVEDDFAKQMIETALRYRGGIEIDAIQIHAMGGEDPAKKVNEQHNKDPSSKFPSVCVLDGDQFGKFVPTSSEFMLPGQGLSPETHVFESVADKIDTIVAKLTLSLQLPTSEQDRVAKVVKLRQKTNVDRHIIFQQIGDDLDFIASRVVSGAFLALWAQTFPLELNELVSAISSRLPMVAEVPTS